MDEPLSSSGFYPSIASPESLRARSSGEVTTPVIIDFTTGQFTDGGLFCERIFGPAADDAPGCGNLSGVEQRRWCRPKRSAEWASSCFRSRRTGHVELAAPVCHPSYVSSALHRFSGRFGFDAETVKNLLACRRYLLKSVDSALIGREARIALGWLAGMRALRICPQHTFSRLEQAITTVRAIHEGAVIDEESFYLIDSIATLLAASRGEDKHRLYRGATGGEAVRQLLSTVELARHVVEIRCRSTETLPNRREQVQLCELLEGMRASHTRPEWVVLQVLPVLAPALRPIWRIGEQKFAVHPLNNHYRRVINRNNRLKMLMEIAAPEVVINRENRLLQEAVNSVIDCGGELLKRALSPHTGEPAAQSLEETSDAKCNIEAHWSQSDWRKEIRG
jgi:DNA-directed RNA polymerase subunit beta'